MRKPRINWYLAFLQKYAVFSGWARHKEHWFFSLFNVLLVFMLPDSSPASNRFGANPKEAIA